VVRRDPNKSNATSKVYRILREFFEVPVEKNEGLGKTDLKRSICGLKDLNRDFPASHPRKEATVMMNKFLAALVSIDVKIVLMSVERLMDESSMFVSIPAKSPIMGALRMAPKLDPAGIGGITLSRSLGEESKSAKPMFDAIL